MIIELGVLTLVGLGMYYYNGTLNVLPYGTVTTKLDSMIDSGYQFRDQTFSTMADIIVHPDVKNSKAGYEMKPIQDLGVFGSNRESFQLYPGLSEITQISNTRNMIL